VSPRETQPTKIMAPSVEEMMDLHGAGAMQVAIDEIVASIRCGDHSSTIAWDKLLQALEVPLGAAHDARVVAETGDTADRRWPDRDSGERS
jgi:hypothetical protein